MSKQEKSGHCYRKKKSNASDKRYKFESENTEIMSKWIKLEMWNKFLQVII